MWAAAGAFLVCSAVPGLYLQSRGGCPTPTPPPKQPHTGGETAPAQKYKHWEMHLQEGNFHFAQRKHQG